MPGDLTPEAVLADLRKERIRPFYLLHGPSEFRLEKFLATLREEFLPPEARALNQHLFYGDEAEPGAILDAARSMPFLSAARLIIVRRTEAFPAAKLEAFLDYLGDPSESTCMVFTTAKADFRRKFYVKFRDCGTAVNFRHLSDRQTLMWLKRTAEGMGLQIDRAAYAHLLQIVGRQLRELHAELEKLYVRHGERSIGVAEIQEMAVMSRSYSIFELMDEVSARRSGQALTALNRFLQEHGRESALQITGMLNRQIKLLWRVRAAKGDRPRDIANRLRIQLFQAQKLAEQSARWSRRELERAVHLPHRADGQLKSGSDNRMVLESLLLELCAQEAVN